MNSLESFLHSSNLKLIGEKEDLDAFVTLTMRKKLSVNDLIIIFRTVQPCKKRGLWKGEGLNGPEVLRPCPFCGGPAAIKDEQHGYEDLTLIQCDNCGACICESVETGNGWHHRAVEKWNSRPE